MVKATAFVATDCSGLDALGRRWAATVGRGAIEQQLAPSPVVELNRAVAVAMASGPAAGLELVDALTHDSSLENYHLLPSVRGDLLAKLARHEEARVEFERAASLTRNARDLVDYLSLAFGLALAPVFAAYGGRLDLLWTGLVGGAAAWLVHRSRKKASAT